MNLLAFLLALELISSSYSKLHLRRPGNGKGGKMASHEVNKDSCYGKHITCEKDGMYRTISGVCNNLNNPYWGAASSIIKRLLAPEYYDCKGIPKGGYVAGSGIQHRKLRKAEKQNLNYVAGCRGSNQSLPNVREVSTTFHADVDLPRNYFSLMVMQFGQFVDHDIALSPEVETEEECCEHPDTKDCFPIYIPNEDPFYSTRSALHCHEFTRTDAFCQENGDGEYGNTREQYSIVTSFLDNSQVYSANEDDAVKLRSTDGKLKTNLKYSREMLPKLEGKLFAGDMRALDMPGLATMHTLFVREHNRIASILLSEKIYDDEQIYQKARRIVIAQYQNIVYNEYIPVILGKRGMKKYGLSMAKQSNYNEEEDPSLLNGFATAAYRFGHSLIQGMINMADVNDPDSIVKIYQLRENFFNMENYLLDDGLGMDQIVAGLIGQKAQALDRFITEDVTNFLFMEFGEDTGNRKKRDFGADLVSRNLQRGRDHGLPGYNKYRQFCHLRGLPKFNSKKSPSEMSAENWKILSELYETPDDIDLFAGGLAEYPIAGGLTGPTFNCLKSLQFKRLMDGDRFFFNHKNEVGSFNSKQLNQLLKRTLRDLICENTELAKARKNVFLLQGEMIDCKIVNPLDIKIFI